MARELARGALLAAALLVLAAGLDAQRGSGQRGARGGRRGGAQAAPTAPDATAKPEAKDLPPIYLPGYGSLKGGNAAKGGKPAPAAPKGQKPAKPGPAEPADPMKAADLVTAAADHRAVRSEAEQRLLREHFGVCDLDDNGWISLREGEVTLSLGRDEFKRADANQDGGLDAGEFEAQQGWLLARLGAREAAVPPEHELEPAREPPADPLIVPGAADAAPRRAPSELASMLVRPVDLLRRYDADRSKGISVAEVEKLFTELGLALSAEMVVAQMDPNASGELGTRELTPLAWLASEHMPESLRPDFARPPEAPAGEDEEEPAPADATITHFELLDDGGDGFVDEADLRKLQGNVRLELRIRSVLLAMDGDGDGRLSEGEFRSAMTRAAD
jgi:Ca2+-binding EF-hand superfamily protein